MAKNEDIKNRYFPHDLNASNDEKIMDMMFYFRHNQEFLDETILPYAALGVYWMIVEHLHISTISKSKLDRFADGKRINLKFLQKILDNFDLFQLEKDEYLNERVLQNIAKIKQLKESARNKANKRWNKPAEKTVQEEQAIKQAKNNLSDNISLHQELTQYDEYRTLEETAQSDAIIYFKLALKNSTKKQAIEKLLDFLRKNKD